MKALTLTQPWATLVVLGTKRFETRGWAPRAHTLGRVAIHASKAWRPEDRDLADELRAANILAVKGLPMGAVIGEVTIGRIFRVEDALAHGHVDAGEAMLGDYSLGRFAWELLDPIAYPTPIEARGALGIWEWAGAANGA